MDAVDILVQPFGVQNSMPPVENKILNNKVEYYLAENYFPTFNDTENKIKFREDSGMVQAKKKVKVN